MAPSERVVRAWIALAAAVACAAGAGSCRVDTPDGLRFACRSDADCGDDGSVCAPGPGDGGTCCIASPEVCDGNDNDCNGLPDDEVPPATCYEGPTGTAGVGICRPGQRFCLGGQMAEECVGQILPQSETCNGVDDDCDGEIDEGPLPSEPNHCGRCGNRCDPTHQCRAGECIPSSEPRCDDNLDEDGDGLTDCADPDCDGRACGAASRCRTLACTPNSESSCGDGVDDDGDALVDCADTDCDGRSCGVGCLCDARMSTESNCQDATDNDHDRLVDCRDVSDCRDKPCTTDSGSPGTCRVNRRCQ